MAVESTGHSQGNPRLFEVIEHAPKTGKSPTVWAWPQLIDYLKVAGPAGAGTVAASPGAAPRPRGASRSRSQYPTRSAGAAPAEQSTRPGGRTRRHLPVPVPLRSPAFDRRGDRPAARRRRRGQGPRRRAEPHPAAEAALRRARAAGRHQQHAGARLPPRRAPTAPSGSARCAGTPTWSARRSSRRCSPTMAAAAPLIADPIVRNRGHARRLAVPRRPAGRLGLGRDRARRPRRGAGVRGSAHHPGHRLRQRPVPERARRTTRSPSRPSIPAPKGEPAGGYLKLERRVGDFATVGVAVAVELSGGSITRAGIALTGVGGSTIDADRRRAGARRRAAHRRQHRPGGRAGRAGRAAAHRPPRQRRVQAADRAHVRDPHPDPRRRRQTEKAA